MRLLAFLIVMIVMVSCEKDLMVMEALGSNTAIVGTWIEDGQEGDTLFLQRNGAFDKEKYGFTINDDDLPRRFFQSGGSGTRHIEIPPLSREDFIKTRDSYYIIRGLDKNGGPLEKKIKELGL